MIYLLFLIMCSLSDGFLHEFYVSVTNIRCVGTDSLRITTRVFYDDILQDIRSTSDPDWVFKDDDPVLLTYLGRHIRLGDGALLIPADSFTSLKLEGEGETRTLTIDLELPQQEVRTYGISITLLTDLYEDQINMVHYKCLDQRASKSLALGDSHFMIN